MKTSLWNCTVTGCMAVAACAQVLAGRVAAETISEGFDLQMKTWQPIGSVEGAGSKEIIRRSASSRFAWGAFCQPGSVVANPETSNTCKWISLTPGGFYTHLCFDFGCFVAGNYAYTRFDCTDDGSTNIPDRRIDLSSPEAQVSLTLWHNQQESKVAILLRDGANWYCSDDIVLPKMPWNQFNIEQRFEYAPKKRTWYRLLNTADMDEVVEGGSQPVQRGAEAVPEFSSIEGMGIMCRSGAPGNREYRMYLSGMALSDGRSPKADLSVPMQNSDVAFLHFASPTEKSDECGGTKIVYWGAGWSARRTELVRSAGVRYMPVTSMGSTRVSMLESYPNIPDLPRAVAKDLWGRDVLVGNPTYPAGRIARMCNRHPAFRACVKEYLRLRVFDIGADEANLDECAGANGGIMLLRDGAGCFCDRCNEGFRDFLIEEGHTSQTLMDAGVPPMFADIENFDYRALLRKRLPMREDEKGLPLYGEWQGAFNRSTKGDYREDFARTKELPLIREFMVFQQLPARGLFREVRQYAEELAQEAGRPPFKVSANAYNLRAESLYTAEEATADFLGAECQVFVKNTRSNLPKHLIRLRLADAVGVRVVTPGVHWEWEQARHANLVENVKLVIAAHYASGHQLSVPDFYDWVEPDYYGRLNEYAPFYRFVRSRPELFDGYETVGQVGVFYNSDPLVSGQDLTGVRLHGNAEFIADYHDAAVKLTGNRIPFGVVAGADGRFYTREFTKENIVRQFSFFIAPRNLGLKGRQKAILDELTEEGRVYQWTGEGFEDIKRLRALVKPWTACSANNVWMVPRKKGQDRSDLIVHLINMNYLEKEDTVTPKTGFTVTLLDGILDGEVQRVCCYTAPDGAMRELEFSKSNGGIQISVPSIDYWNVLKVEYR